MLDFALSPGGIWLLALLIFFAAALYSSVGHAGASGYLAAMSLLSVAPGTMKPTALILNVLVATIATLKFYRAGCFSWQLVWPFMLTSVPTAFLGGMWHLPGNIYKQLVGVVLFVAALRMLLPKSAESGVTKLPPRSAALACGAGIGLLSGLTGTGGGIFLSPLLVLMGWADIRKSAGVAASFILVNSFAGFAGYWLKSPGIPSGIWTLGVAAVAGGWIGSELGSKRLGSMWLRRLLGIVLAVASAKMIFT